MQMSNKNLDTTEVIEKSYFANFCEEYKITDENNTIEAFIKFPSEPKQKITTKIFTEDKEGNLDILVYNLDGELIAYDNKNATPEKPNINNNRVDWYKVKRYADPKKLTDPKTGEITIMKYCFPKGTGTHPFIPPMVRNKFIKKEKIKTLVLTEGYKKAWLSAYYGLDIIGLSSITHFRDKDTQGMYNDVLRIVKECEVENIILLHDGDCMNISLNAFEKEKDLYTRPGGFYKAALTVRELFKSYNDKVEFYFSHVNSSINEENPKGIDDLLICFKGEEKEIINSLLNYSHKSAYFYRENITLNYKLLTNHFGFNNVDVFYLKHQERIKEKLFVYHGTKYLYNEKEGRCIIVRPAEADEYFRIGDTYYKFIRIPNKYKQLEKTFQARQKGTIIDDLGKDIIKHIPKYEAFCNIPSHIEYNMIMHNCFNVYSPFTYEPENGKCDLSLEFVRHIFGEHYEYGLDYLQLLYQKPTQMLPILCLISYENNTGKSTFVKWLKAIFTQNCTIVGNDQFQDQFNGSWATKLLIACEESFIEKQRVMEKIKQFSTGDKIPLRMMQRDAVEIDFFGKFILCSNKEDKFIIAGAHDDRFWLRKIPTPTNDNINILHELINEIPFFLNYLNNRKIFSKQEGRMWFRKGLLITEVFKKLVEANRPSIEKELFYKLKELFIDTNAQILHIPMAHIKTYLLNNAKYQEDYIKQTLIKMGIEQYSVNGKYVTKRCKAPFHGQDGKIIYVDYVLRPYVFFRKDFLTEKEFEKYNNSEIENED